MSVYKNFYEPCYLYGKYRQLIILIIFFALFIVILWNFILNKLFKGYKLDSFNQSNFTHLKQI